MYMYSPKDRCLFRKYSLFFKLPILLKVIRDSSSLPHSMAHEFQVPVEWCYYMSLKVFITPTTFPNYPAMVVFVLGRWNVTVRLPMELPSSSTRGSTLPQMPTVCTSVTSVDSLQSPTSRPMRSSVGAARIRLRWKCMHCDRDGWRGVVSKELQFYQFLVPRPLPCAEIHVHIFSLALFSGFTVC